MAHRCRRHPRQIRNHTQKAGHALALHIRHTTCSDYSDAQGIQTHKLCLWLVWYSANTLCAHVMHSKSVRGELWLASGYQERVCFMAALGDVHRKLRTLSTQTHSCVDSMCVIPAISSGVHSRWPPAPQGEPPPSPAGVKGTQMPPSPATKPKSHSKGGSRPCAAHAPPLKVLDP